MAEVLTDAGTWGVLAVIAAAGVVRWLMHREPWWVIALACVGTGVFYAGLRWAGRVDPEALLAAAVAAFGIGVASHAEKLGERRRAVATKRDA
jgi:hypothetical protein